jgi:hypothetical protein
VAVSPVVKQWTQPTRHWDCRPAILAATFGTVSGRTDMTTPAFLIGVALAVVAVIGGVTVALVPIGGGPPATAGSGSLSTDALPQTADSQPTDEPFPTEDPADTFPSEDPTDPVPTEDPTGTVPDGYQTVSAPAGLTVNIPGTWPVKAGAVASNLQADDPDADCLLRFGGDTAADAPLLDVVAGFEKHTPSIRTDFRRLQLTSISYGRADEAVDWEFTFSATTGPRHAYGRYWRTGGTDYVAYGSCSDGDWTQLGAVLTTLFDTADPQ